MKVTQEKLPASQIGLEIEIPPELSAKTYDRTLQNFQRSVNIPGFRKGKVPRQVLLQRLGPDRIKAAALEEIVQEALKQAIEQEKIDALGNYQLDSDFDALVGQYTPGQALTFSAKVDVPPQVTLDAERYEGLEVRAEEIKYDPQQVEDYLEERRVEQATLIPIEDRPAQMGDVAIVDFEGRLAPETEGEETEPFAGGTAEDFQVEMVEGKLIPGFVEQMAGMKLEETKEIEVKFPEEYGNEELAGQDAIFKVTLKELKEKELPELNDDFAKEASEYETLAELRESLETRFKTEAENRTAGNVKAALMKALVEKVEIDLPETMISKEVDTILTQRAMQLEQYGIDVRQMYNQDTLPKLRSQSRPEATDRLYQNLMLEEISRANNLEPDSEAIEQRNNELLEQLGQDVDRDRLAAFVTEELRKDKALDWLKERANIEYVPEGTLSETPDSEAESESDDIPAETATVEVEASTVSEEE
ncbi:MAG: trigger factor [Cyanobacteriota bacterium]|nr:trigger factor [Cyanobacteriota bacterium]